MRWVACLLLLSLAGCTAFISKQEYAAYRAVRMADSHGARLLAMQRYVEGFPSGHFYQEVQEERRTRDVDVFNAGKGTRSGLELYLAAFPDGVFVEQARSRLSAIEVIEERKRQEEARALALAEERKKRDAELRRTWVTRFLGYWTRSLAGVSNWGEPIAQVARANTSFSQGFARPPRPRCTADECVKYYDSPYAVPVPGGTRMERHMRLVLRVQMEEGRVERAALLLPGWGFSRWAELEQRRAVIDGDPEDRRGAVDWALERIMPELEKLPGGLQLIEGYELAAITPPSIAASGELTDTTALDPSAPVNRIQGSAPATAGAGQGAAPALPSVEELVQPEAPEEAPDMVMAPMGVDEEGRAVRGGEMTLAPMVVPPEGAAPEMEMAPLEIPADGQAPTEAADPDQAIALAEAQALVVPPMVRAYRAGGLRIVVFTAGTDAGAPAYDGVLIERAR